VRGYLHAMSETPQGDDARRIVDELEDEHVDVEAASDGAVDETHAEDENEAVPGSPEPTD
jgi:hypothetical protein